jgi:hypothetical protein
MPGFAVRNYGLRQRRAFPASAGEHPWLDVPLVGCRRCTGASLFGKPAKDAHETASFPVRSFRVSNDAGIARGPVGQALSVLYNPFHGLDLGKSVI